MRERLIRLSAGRRRVAERRRGNARFDSDRIRAREYFSRDFNFNPRIFNRRRRAFGITVLRESLTGKRLGIYSAWRLLNLHLNAREREVFK